MKEENKCGSLPTADIVGAVEKNDNYTSTTLYQFVEPMEKFRVQLRLK